MRLVLSESDALGGARARNKCETESAAQRFRGQVLSRVRARRGGGHSLI